jgi:serine/threonine-protein kinase
MPDDLLERLRAALHDRYRLDRRVGQGGMATVYLAEDLKHHRQVALKVLRPELSASLGTERFLREIALAAQLQHPHIVPVYDSGSADGLLYYVMPFVEGESLRDLVRREGRVSLDRAAEIVREAASGLQYAHDQGVVHRDIKPENIMLSGGHAVVADFGIARAIDASRSEDVGLTGTGIAIGTPAYMSPEQATADRVDARTDQYALACVFYEMVSGKQAFAGPTVQAILTAMLTGPRPRLSAVAEGVPGEVDGATQRALATDPADRFDSITAFARAVARESSGVAAAARESRRWRRLAIALPLVVVALGAAWVILFGVPGRVVVSGAETIAVVPFTASGPGTEGIGEGMVDIMAGNLDGVGPIRTIEPRTVMREWRRRVRDGDGDLDDALAVARGAKAASVLTGSVVATGGTARLTAELYDINGTKLADDFVDGPSDSLLALADGLALKLLRQIWSSREPLPSANSSGITSASMPAIRAYLTGERYHRRGIWDSAEVAFERAVSADSTFALAWYRLANTLGWQGAYLSGRAIEAAGRAVEFSDSLSPRIRSLLVAYNLFTNGNPAATDSALRYVRRYPDDADGWYLLGESRYHTRAYDPRPPAQLLEPFDRVIALDSSLTPAAIHPMEMAVAARDTELLARYVGVLRAAGLTEEVERTTMAAAVIDGDTAALGSLLRTGGSSGTAFAALQAALADPDLTGDALLTLARSVAVAAPDGPAGLQQRAGAIMMAGGMGRVEAADSLIALVGPDDPNLQSLSRIPALYGGFATRDQLVRTDSQLSAATSSNPFFYFTHALVAYDLGQPARSRALIRTGLGFVEGVNQRWLGPTLSALDGLAQMAQGDTARGLAVVDSSLREVGGQTPSQTMAVLLRYALHLAATPARRDDGIRRLRFGFPYSSELIPVRHYFLARAYEAAGRPDSAIRNYGVFTRLFDAPDSAYHALTEDAKEALARLTGEPTSPGAAVPPSDE